MGDTVWGDVLFLVNFSMDYLCFFITARVRGRRLLPLRTAAASALGGAYAVAALLLDGMAESTGARLLLLFCDAAVLLVICTVASATRETTVGGLFLTCGVFLAVSVLIGGVMTALYSLLDRVFPPGAPGAKPDGLSVWLFALLAALGGAAALLWGRRRRHAAATLPVTVRRGGREVTLTALCDSGNLLCDPLGGRAVLLCELDAVAPLFPPELVRFWRDGGRVSRAAELPRPLAAELRFVPTRSPAGEDTILCAVPADEIRVTESTGGSARELPELLIAPVCRRLGREFRAILPESVLSH